MKKYDLSYYLILDLYCGAGGSAVGIANACRKYKKRFKIIGIDIKRQKNYPFEFIQQDVLDLSNKFLKKFDFIWASPPCQLYSNGTARWRNIEAYATKYVDLIDPTRNLLKKSKVPFVIENVIGAPLRKDLILCGQMFNLKVIRHRIFEIWGFSVKAPYHPYCRDLVKKGKAYTIAGGGGNSKSYKFEDWKKAMGISWMNKKELIEAIPPAYSEYIFSKFINFKSIESFYS
ncbi:MAG: DNA cytosine methyltransferase [Candidatus Helarchaeota archaeon]